MILFKDIQNTDEQIQYFSEKKIICQRFNSPRGIAYELSVEWKQTPLTATFYSDKECKTFFLEMISQQAVDPKSYWNVLKTLKGLKVPRILTWELMDSGYYSLRTLTDDRDVLEDINYTLKKMAKLFLTFVPEIELIARGN